MKLKKVASLCNQTGSYHLYDNPDERHADWPTQWLGDGYAAYPIQGLPYMEMENICAMFDITEKRQEKLYMKHNSAPTSLCLKDTEPGEIRVKDPILRVVFKGREYLPLKTPDGIIFIQEKYLIPLEDDLEYLQLFVWKYKDGGGVYVVAKVGLVIQAVIMPVEKVLDAEFMDALDNLVRQCRDAMRHKQVFGDLRESVEPDPDQGNMFNVDQSTGGSHRREGRG